MTAGIASYVVTWLVPHEVGLAKYALFAAFWSFLYLVVGALFGIQQEVTRATRPAESGRPPQVSRARNFGIVAGAALFLAIVGTAPLWVDAVFARDGWALVWPLAVGAASFVMVAVLVGSLYGIAQWIPVALMMIVDALMRLIALAIVLYFTTDIVALAWAVVAPFPVTLLLLWPFIRRSIVGKTQLDVGYRALSWNVARTTVAATSTGVMVSGYPLLLGLSAGDQPAELLGLYILTITLTRAPLIVIAMSLQSYFIVMFRDDVTHFWRKFLRLQALVGASAVVLAIAGWLIGPAVFAFLFPDQLRPEGWFIAVLVFSSALVGSMCISAPAVLAQSQHFVYTAGWVAAAFVTILALLLPLGFTERTVLSLLAGPVAGLLVYAGYLVRSRRSHEPNLTTPPRD